VVWHVKESNSKCADGLLGDSNVFFKWDGAWNGNGVVGLECGSELVALLFGDSVGAREFEGEDIKAGQYSAATTREQNEGTFVVARYGSYGDSEL
jgi:hypothetical protein